MIIHHLLLGANFKMRYDMKLVDDPIYFRFELSALFFLVEAENLEESIANDGVYARAFISI